MAKQMLHLVIGGELRDPTSTEFTDLSKVELVGLYPNYAEAFIACTAGLLAVCLSPTDTKHLLL